MVSQRIWLSLLVATASLGPTATPEVSAQAARGWLSWRGPDQNGTCAETGLLDRVEPVLAGLGLAHTRLDGSTRDRQAVVEPGADVGD